MKYLYVIFFVIVFLSASAQDARIYFYRDAKFVGAIVGYNVCLDSALVGRASSGSVLSYSSAPGLKTIRAKTEGESSLTIELKAGVTYYIECGIEIGAVAGRPSFRQVSASEAKAAVSKINPQLVMAIDVDPQFATDTARALNNMFHRKKIGGVTRAIVFGVLGLGSLIGTISQSGSSSTVGGATIDTGPDPANYVFIGVCTVLTITGITQASKYNRGRLTQVVREYNEGKGVPNEFKSKLKTKDFK